MLFHVTGASGLVGKEVVAKLSEIGEVHGTDVDSMDVTNMNSVKSTFEKRPPDAVVHLAGLKGNLPSREDPLRFFNVNTTGVLNLLDASRQFNCKHFIFFSSLTVHGPVVNPVTEESPLAPQHPYSGSKAAAEPMVHSYSQAYGMKATIFRPNFIVGPIPAPLPYLDNLVYDFIELAQGNGVIELAGDGQFEREWMHPQDIASAVAMALSSPMEGCQTYILRGERVTMAEFAQRIVNVVGTGKITTNPDRGGFSITSSSAKATRELGWNPTIDLNTLIAQIFDEYTSR